jgi:hypothetical protein
MVAAGCERIDMDTTIEKIDAETISAIGARMNVDRGAVRRGVMAAEMMAEAVIGGVAVEAGLMTAIEVLENVAHLIHRRAPAITAEKPQPRQREAS